METRVNYTVVGLFVIVLSMALVVAGFWIARKGQSKPYYIYATDMHEAVSGLNVNAPVKFNGVNVGYVSQMELDRKDPTIVHLLMKIVDGTPINESTTATLMSQGITGISYIGLKTAAPNAPPLVAKKDEDYPTIEWAPSVLFQLDVALRDLNNNIKSVTVSLNELLNEQNQQAIQQSLANIAKFTDSLAANSQDMGELIKNSSAASEKLPALMQQMQTTLTQINAATKQVGAAGNTANEALRDSKVVIDTFSQQTLPSTIETMNRLNKVLGNLQDLTTQLQTNPSMLVRGVQPKPLGPGEK